MHHISIPSLTACLQLCLVLFAAGKRSAAIRFPSPTIVTTSGKLVGVDDGAGVISFKKVPYAQPPTGNRRWKPPEILYNTQTVDATKLGPSCLQHFPTAPAPPAVVIPIFNTPAPPSESEDCLYLNVWAPARKEGPQKAVIFWIHGGSLSYGTASSPHYDGTSLAKNQDVVVVSINYRTNVFGFPFPAADGIPLTERNLGILDQELAFQWVRQNIEAVGGDPNRISLMGQSAGATSVAWFLQRHGPNPPFQSAVLLSSVFLSESTPNTYEQAWTTFSNAVGCALPAGTQRLRCLKQVPASAIIDYWNIPTSPPMFAALIDNITVFANPMQRIMDNQIARVPILQGSTQDDGSMFAEGKTDVAAVVDGLFHGAITPSVLEPLYPGLSGLQEISLIFRDFLFLCQASLHTGAYVQAGIADVYRYIYGAVFEDQQVLPDLGAFHSSELPGIFGTFNRTTANSPEVQLSDTLQTIVGSFAKNPFTPPLPSWPKYNPNSTTLAKLAFNGNVALTDVVQTASPASEDQTCSAFWDKTLVSPPTGANFV